MRIKCKAIVELIKGLEESIIDAGALSDSRMVNALSEDIGWARRQLAYRLFGAVHTEKDLRIKNMTISLDVSRVTC